MLDVYQVESIKNPEVLNISSGSSLQNLQCYSYWPVVFQEEIDRFIDIADTSKSSTIGGVIYERHFIPRRYSFLISKAIIALNSMSNKSIVSEATNLLYIIRDSIIYFGVGYELSYLPALSAFKVDDGSVLIEWIFDDFRIGFSIEPNVDESSWYLVSNEKLGDIGASGYISRNNINNLVLWLINFVIANS